MFNKIIGLSFKLILFAMGVGGIAPIFSDYTVDLQSSRIGFTAYSRIHDVDGQFSSWRFEGRIKDDLSGKGKIVIQLTSVDSGNKKRDEHLRDPDFFDVAKFPEAIYSIDNVQTSNDRLIVKGRLLLHGVEKAINLNLHRRKEAADWILAGETTLQQKDFGMVYSSLINPVKSEVTLKFYIVLKKK